ncbi:hypothetical protein CROQUDRAFT_650045 [Cronartium quercuum f. sp. fusiforme G11]|uniref:NAD(P)-binding protein n=1 Tax=Cronartium quercuum f. sp. fusiforme G11 TaxID=708437 RepID=A0A9P6TH89_9BASI|nr:hypothetical protein CROQUDRAFT_650045 [Cronartium quercuum f. sp. fusiforme G11]
MGPMLAEPKQESVKVTGETATSLPIGVDAARHYVEDSKNVITKTISDEFRLNGRTALVTGANGGLGLEMALVLAELGATVYAIDLFELPSKDFMACASYTKALLSHLGQEAKDRMHYKKSDVTNQEGIRALCKEIVQREGRLDVCVAAAGILHDAESCLTLSVDNFKRVMDVNTNGVFITATAAAYEMAKNNIPGSIIMIASMSGSITNRDHDWISYNTSKSAVLQMARSMACELGPKGIRVNTISPGYIKTAMTKKFLDSNPSLEKKWSNMNPLGRLGKLHEVRGVTAWLASDASTFCTGSEYVINFQFVHFFFFDVQD